MRWKAFLLGLIIQAFCPWTPSICGEEVDTWLEQRGMTRLLVEHLEGTLSGLEPKDRGPVMVRLAQLYAQLLSETDDQAARIAFEEKGRRLLKEVRGTDALSLELELSHGTYLGIEQAAEQHRLRLLEDRQKTRLLESLQELIDQLKPLGRRVQKLVEMSTRGLERVESRIHKGRSKQDVLLEMSNRINFLLGWCLYYQSWISNDLTRAEEAERYFSRVLSLDEFSPQDVSRDLRASSAIAWSVIGMALVNQQIASDLSAMEWLDLLEDPIVPQEIRSQLPGWRLAILLESGKFKEAEAYLQSISGQLDIPISWIRMCAVLALDSPDESGARSLAATALAELASLGELGQLHDIVSRYAESIDGESFPFAYARAILDYRLAMDLQESIEVDVSTRTNAWIRSRESVERSLLADDVERFDQARQQARLLKAWSLYYLGEYEAAGQLFEQVSDLLPERDSGEALWMAYVSEERRLELVGSESTRARVEALIDRYLERYPDGPRAGELTVRMAAGSEKHSMESVDELLSVPLDSPARDEAESRAADILYRLFRDASDFKKKEKAVRYLSVAVPLMQREFESEEELQAAKSIARSRRILEVATNPNVLRLVAADAAMEILNSGRESTQHRSKQLLDEIEYRTILMLLARSNVDKAAESADVLYERNPAGVWSRLAIRRIIEYSMDSLRELGIDAQDGAHRRIVKFGMRLLTENSPLEESLKEKSNRSFASIVGQSAMALSTVSNVVDDDSEQMLAMAWDLYDLLLIEEPRNESFLKSRAQMASSRGDDDEALRCWRIIAAGSPSGSEEWFQARCELLLILERTDPERARQVLDQHLVLYPGYGPEPWGEILGELALRLSKSVHASKDGTAE